MNPRDRTLGQLRRLEGRVAHAYQDHLGYWTIGDGILIDERRGGGLLPEEMDFITQNRLFLLEKDLDDRLHWWRQLSPARQGVILLMAWQMGMDGLLGFHSTLRAVQEMRWRDAKRGMLASKWARQTPNRAKAMADQMLTGEWVNLDEYSL